MTVACVRSVDRPTAFRRFQVHGWDIHLATAGAGRIQPEAPAISLRLVLTEGAGARRSPEPGLTVGSRTELLLAPDGTVRAQCAAGPPVLVVPAGTEPVCTPIGSCVPATVSLGPGDLLLACSPSVLDALEPGEVVAAPRLLQRCPDHSSLLRRWMETVDRRGGPGASAAVARRVGRAADARRRAPARRFSYEARTCGPGEPMSGGTAQLTPRSDLTGSIAK